MSNPGWYGSRWAPRKNEIPVLGDWLSKAGQIKAMWAQPCDPDPYIMVLAWFHHLPMLGWSLFKPDPNDKVTERFGMGHRKRRRMKAVFNDLLMGQEVPRGGLTWVMFRLGSLAQRVGWWMTIIDATLDFHVAWTSTSFQWAGCNTPINWQGVGKLTNQGITNNGGTGQLSTLWEVVSAHNCLVAFNGISSLVPTQDISMGLTIETEAPTFMEYRPPKRIFCHVNQVGQLAFDGSSNVVGSKNAHVYNSSVTAGPWPSRRWNVVPYAELQATGGFVIKSALLWAGSAGQRSILADP